MEKVKRYAIYSDVFKNDIVKICQSEQEAKELVEDWNIPHPFTFADEIVTYSYKEIWV